MTNNGNTTMRQTPVTEEHACPPGVEDLDLTPDGLADAPASQEDHDSLVHTGNS